MYVLFFVKPSIWIFILSSLKEVVELIDLEFSDMDSDSEEEDNDHTCSNKNNHRAINEKKAVIDVC